MRGWVREPSLEIWCSNVMMYGDNLQQSSRCPLSWPLTHTDTWQSSPHTHHTPHTFNTNTNISTLYYIEPLELYVLCDLHPNICQSLYIDKVEPKVLEPTLVDDDQGYIVSWLIWRDNGLELSAGTSPCCILLSIFNCPHKLRKHINLWGLFSNNFYLQFHH